MRAKTKQSNIDSNSFAVLRGGGKNIVVGSTIFLRRVVNSVVLFSIREIRHYRNVGVLTKIVGDEVKSSNVLLRLSPVKLCNNVRSVPLLADDEHRTKVVGFSLLIERLFDPGVPEQNQVTFLKVEVLDSSYMISLEMLEGLTTVVGDGFSHILNVLRTFLELTCADRDEFFSRDTEVLLRGQVSSLNDVEREKGVNAMSHVVRGVAGGFVNSNSFGPENLGQDLTPLRLVPFTGFHDCFPNVEMLGLHDSIGLRIVARDPDMVDVVSLTEPVRSSDIGRGVIGNNFRHTSPPTEDTENKHPNDFSRFRGRSLPFGPRDQSTSGMKYISITSDFRHEEGVHVGSSKQGGNGRNDWRDMKVLHLTNLALMTRLGVPLDVIVQKRPPESDEDIPSC